MLQFFKIVTLSYDFLDMTQHNKSRNTVNIKDVTH